MFYIEIDSYAVTASFRIPESHTFQQTLPLPPLTTLIGMLGAGAGFSFEQAMKYYETNEIRIGVVGSHKGTIKDLWKYRKIKTQEIISAVLLKEYISDLSMKIYFASNNKELIKKIRSFFTNPVYALSAGSSDDLLKIKKISEIMEGELANSYCFEKTVIAGDHSNNYETNINIKNITLMQDFYAPQVYLLPTEFKFMGSERRVKKRQPFTYVDAPIKLVEPVLALKVNNMAINLL